MHGSSAVVARELHALCSARAAIVGCLDIVDVAVDKSGHCTTCGIGKL